MPRKVLGLLTEILVDNLTDAVIGIDREGKIQIYNPAAAQVFAVSQKQAMGSKVWDCLPLTDFTRHLIAMVKESHPTFTERTYPFPQGQIFLGQLLPVKNEEGRLAGAVSILKDLTHLHRIETHVTDFVGNVSQELRLPLTSIKGFVETLLEGAMADPGVTRKFLQVINDETNRMARLLMSLQDVTSPPGARPAAVQAVDLRRLLVTAVNTLRPLAEQKRVTIDMAVPNELPLMQGDPDGLMQVLTNLIDNAIKFTGIKGGPGRVSITARHEGNRLHVSIGDDGVGIPAAEMENIFQRFYRVSEGPAAQLGGTGLGLFISREIVRAHGGDIQVESQPGQGSTFRVGLPLGGASASKPHGPSRAATSPPPRASSPR